ncbi:MAG: 2Fe-2S iron-sulfur cluster-binding protein [Thermincola sp.]|jgi:NADH dehydrogenase/NADH:ubiquinone oxidoreductase subunit G|nr:2Fe-2S iron-sulfur cluster-binding protein [Thermincola sp.]MDT3703319.1 2Fe-2S iron-sulfur cluster-binding protein [Thermincola sp.]
MNQTVTITIDDKHFSAQAGISVLKAALENGIYIPHLCAHDEAEKPAASCRLCFVEVDGLLNPVTACTQPVVKGMVVRTRSKRIDRLVGTAFELLLSNHRLGCAKCARNGSCELQKIAKERGLKLKLNRLRQLTQEQPIDDSLDSFVYDPSRCVLCGRCVWADQQKAKVGAIGFVKRGIARKVSTFGETSLAESRCTECNECVRVCPVGALIPKARG